MKTKIKNESIRRVWGQALWTGFPATNWLSGIIAAGSFLLLAVLFNLLLFVFKAFTVDSEELQMIEILFGLLIVVALILPMALSCKLYAADGNNIYLTTRRWATSPGEGSWFSEEYSNIEFCTVKYGKNGLATFEFKFKNSAYAGVMGNIKKLVFRTVQEPDKLLEILKSKSISIR